MTNPAASVRWRRVEVNEHTKFQARCRWRPCQKAERLLRHLTADGDGLGISNLMRKRMKPDAYMPLYIGDWLKDTGHLDATCQGAYFLLCLHHWGKPGIPSDPESLLAITRVRPADWARVGGLVKPFFKEENGLWINKRCLEEYAEIDRIYQAKVTGGQNRANDMWKDRTPIPAKQDSYKDTNKDSLQQKHSSSTQSESESESESNRESKKKVAPLCDVFPENLKSDKFSLAWESWLLYLSQRRKKPTESTKTAQLKKLSEFGIEKAVLSIETSIEKGWQGLFEPNSTVVATNPKDDWRQSL